MVTVKACDSEKIWPSSYQANWTPCPVAIRYVVVNTAAVWRVNDTSSKSSHPRASRHLAAYVPNYSSRFQQCTATHLSNVKLKQSMMRFHQAEAAVEAAQAQALVSNFGLSKDTWVASRCSTCERHSMRFHDGFRSLRADPPLTRSHFEQVCETNAAEAVAWKFRADSHALPISVRVCWWQHWRGSVSDLAQPFE